MRYEQNPQDSKPQALQPYQAARLGYVRHSQKANEMHRRHCKFQQDDQQLLQQPVRYSAAAALKHDETNFAWAEPSQVMRAYL
jgi:hypothetical protein